MRSYTTNGVCTKKIDVAVKDGKVEKITFHSGCAGNLEGVSRLAEGMDVKEVIKRLKLKSLMNTLEDLFLKVNPLINILKKISL